MQFDNAKHRFNVVRNAWLWNVGAARIAIAFESAHHPRDLSRLLVGMTGHDRTDRAGESAASVGVVGQSVAHDERAQIGKTKAERAENVRVLSDFLCRVA